MSCRSCQQGEGLPDVPDFRVLLVNYGMVPDPKIERPEYGRRVLACVTCEHYASESCELGVLPWLPDAACLADPERW